MLLLPMWLMGIIMPSLTDRTFTHPYCSLINKQFSTVKPNAVTFDPLNGIKNKRNRHLDINTLLTRIKTGDRSAFTGVVQHFQQPLFGYLARMGLSQSVCEEIAQETFLRAWTRLNDYDPKRAEFSTWLFTIARNLALHELERAAYQCEISSDETLSLFADEYHQPDEVISHNQQRQHLIAALHDLAVADRSTLALAYIQELDLAAIAQIEGCSTGAIKVRLHRAKQRLQKLLEEKHES